jgi:hypothetical protein
MTTHDFCLWLVDWLWIIANAVVCLASLRFYRQRAMRSVRLIAVSSGLGAVLSVTYSLSEASSSVFWIVFGLLGIVDAALWTVAMCWLYRELSTYDRKAA